MIPLFLFLLGVAAVYAGTIEASFSALMKLSLRLHVERDSRDRLGRYLDQPVRLFLPVRLLLGIIFALSTVLLAQLTGAHTWRSFVTLLVAVGAFILVCEHLIPLLIIRGGPERVLNVLLPSFDVVSRGLAPLAAALVNMTRDRRGDTAENGEEEGGNGPTPPEGPQEQEPALTESEERELLRSIVDFGGTLVREVMTPRPDVVAISADATTGELRALFREQEYSRLPVYTENLDNIVGVVFVKDLLQHEELQEDDSIASLVRAATFVPETKRVAELLKEFQRGQVQIAIVVDEYGGTAGLVTLEDLLEELVGEIRDEYDVESEPVVEEGDGVFTFSAKVSVEEMADRLGIEIEPEGYETVGGYVLSHLGRVPSVGETFDIDGIAVEVLEAERRRIHKVRMRRLPQPETIEVEERG